MCALLCLLVVAAFLLIVDASGASLPRVEGLTLSETLVNSSADGKPQPLIVGVPDGLDPATPTPLLVGIHTWSADYRQMVGQFAPLCAQYGWRLVLPHFRGPNLDSNPACAEAAASLLAQRDVLDALHYMQGAYPLDDTRLYLLGGSGGGHMSLMMAGKYPDLWAGVSAWCPVTDLRDWHAQGNSYAPHVAACCGGAPGDSAAVDFEYLRRSPRTFLTNAAHTPLQIAHGDKDPVIFVTQTWKTYQTLGTIRHRAEFSSWSGGHDLLPDEGFAWLARQVKSPVPPTEQHLVTDEAKWFFWLYVQPAAPLTLARCEAVLGDESPATLRLRGEHCALLRVRLRDLGLPAPTAVKRGGRLVDPGEHRLDGAILELPGGAELEYDITF